MSEQASLLICEDNFSMAALLRFTLEQEGYQVTIARTGTDALQLIQANAYDLVVTDFQMPGANGEDVCRTVRASELNTRIPLVMYTAKGFELSADELKAQFQISALINKPFSPRAMVRLVRSLLTEDGNRCEAVAALEGA
jgi:CheY-like chemotaxis protein